MSKAKLNDDQAQWVEATLSRLTLEECVGQTLMPADRDFSAEEWATVLRDVPLGCLFVDPQNAEDTKSLIALVQKHSKVPLLIAADIEQGLDCGTDFGYALGLAATGSDELVLARSRAVAAEARALGIHWTFQPVADILLNPNNPETNVRAFGDEPERVARLATLVVRGLQEGGNFAATAKHFPGAGHDDRDQHLCTAVNGLSKKAWQESYGRVWRSVLDAGVMTVMTGHISMPAYEGLEERPADAMPATLNHRLQHDFLRQELGFDGLIVSDASPMIGITSRVSSEYEAADFLREGGDVFLFANARRDFERVLQALNSGRLRADRVRDAARHVLSLKARLGLHRESERGAPAALDARENARLAQDIADRAVTVVRRSPAVGAPVASGERALTVTLRLTNCDERRCPELTTVDQELSRRGISVDHLANPSHRQLRDAVTRYSRVFVNVIILPHAQIGHCRMVGDLVMAFWRSFWVGHEHVVFTSFGSPYLLYEQPHWPNFVVAYGPSVSAQRAAVRVWLGELEPTGKLPISEAHLSYGR